MTVLEARGVESDAELAFAGLFDLFRPLGEEDLTRITQNLAADQRHDLLDRLRDGRPVAVERFAICTVVLRILCSAAERQPVLVCVDDAQWLDAGLRGRHPVRRPPGPARPGGRAARGARRRRAPGAAGLRGGRAARAGRRGLGGAAPVAGPDRSWATRPSAGWPRRPGATRWP